MKAVFDTTILIDFLLGKNKAKKEMSLYDEIHISLISWMEILVGAKSNTEEEALKNFLKQFKLCPITLNIANTSIKTRKENRIKLPDAIILATAKELGHLLVTRNSKDFSPKDPGIRIPYKL